MKDPDELHCWLSSLLQHRLELLRLTDYVHSCNFLWISYYFKMRIYNINNNLQNQMWILELRSTVAKANNSVNAATAAKSLQSCPTLCDPIDGSPPGSPVPGILQVRTLEWVAISFSNAWKWKVKVKSLSRVQLLIGLLVRFHDFFNALLGMASHSSTLA